MPTELSLDEIPDSGSEGNFSPPHRVHPASVVHSVSYPRGTGVSYPGVKWPGHETDDWRPYSAQIKKARSRPHVSMAWCLIKQGVLIHGMVLSEAQELYQLCI
jgi:hypothetical protein